jgi:hypothetical protein
MHNLKHFFIKRKLLRLTKRLIVLYQQQVLSQCGINCSDVELTLLFNCDNNVTVQLTLYNISPICSVIGIGNEIMLDIKPYTKTKSLHNVSLSQLIKYIHTIEFCLHNFDTICKQHLVTSTIDD